MRACETGIVFLASSSGEVGMVDDGCAGLTSKLLLIAGKLAS